MASVHTNIDEARQNAVTHSGPNAHALLHQRVQADPAKALHCLEGVVLDLKLSGHGVYFTSVLLCSGRIPVEPLWLVLPVHSIDMVQGLQRKEREGGWRERQREMPT